MNQNTKPTALITGASLGIGFELAKVFAQNGYALILLARSQERLNALKASLPGTHCEVISLDLSAPNAGQELEDRVGHRKIDVLVNNAGFGDYGFFHERDLNKQLQMIDLNVRSLTELTHRFGKKMVAQGSGKIMNVASTAAFQPGPLMAVYYATKHYVLAFSEALHNEWASYNVQVNTLCPGPTESGFQATSNMSKAKLIAKMKMPSAKEVAEFGYAALMRGERTSVHGFANRIMTKMIPFIPKSLVIRIVRMIQSSESA